MTIAPQLNSKNLGSPKRILLVFRYQQINSALKASLLPVDHFKATFQLVC